MGLGYTEGAPGSQGQPESECHSVLRINIVPCDDSRGSSARWAVRDSAAEAAVATAAVAAARAQPRGAHWQHGAWCTSGWSSFGCPVGATLL
jgi:hypothetical protein